MSDDLSRGWGRHWLEKNNLCNSEFSIEWPRNTKRKVPARMPDDTLSQINYAPKEILRGWGQNLTRKVFAVQARGSEFNSQYRH